MVRGLILGAIAFGAVFAAERQFSGFKKDVVRYDKLRAMSGDVPFVREMLGQAQSLIADFGEKGRGETRDLFESLTHDLVRYATIRGM